MPTIAHVVEHEIRKKPFLQEGLVKGVISHSGLAEALLPAVKKELGKEVDKYAVIMAIRRHSEKLEKTFVGKKTLGFETDLTMKSGLVEMTLRNESLEVDKLKRVYELVDFASGDFFTATRGLHETTLLTNRKHLPELRKLFPRTKSVVEGLGSITIRIPENSVEVPGLFFQVTRTLAWENISIVEIVSTYTELTVILKEEDLSKAFHSLKVLLPS